MADAKRPKTEEELQNEDAPEESGGKKPMRRRLVLAGMIAGLMFAEALVIFLFGGGSSQGSSVSAGELEIGDFVFARSVIEAGEIEQARFRLHVRLLPDLAAEADDELTANRFHVREGVEEVLRQAAPADFEDPLLVDLKRRIQERMNEDLGQRAVAKCIVTHFEIVRAQNPPAESEKELARAEPPLKSPESLLNLPEHSGR